MAGDESRSREQRLEGELERLRRSRRLLMDLLVRLEGQWCHRLSRLEGENRRLRAVGRRRAALAPGPAGHVLESPQRILNAASMRRAMGMDEELLPLEEPGPPPGGQSEPAAEAERPPVATAAEYGGDQEATAADPGTPPSGGAAPAGLPIPVACRRFGVAPYVLRGVLDEYPDWLPLTAGDERLLTPEAVDRLPLILRWRGDGLSPDEIRGRLAAGDAAAADPLTALLERLAHLQADLSRSEDRRVQDRDRMMMAMMRTQQEIQHLRFELAAQQSRKDRRRGFWRRLFGR